MQLRYGNLLAFAANCAEIQARSKTMINKGGQAYSVKQSLEVMARLYGNGQNELTQACNGAITALAIPYQDLIFYQDDGVTPSATFLKNAGSISGVVITDGPHFLDNKGSEYNFERTLHFTAEAEYPLANTNSFLLEFHEKLAFEGGGPIDVFMPAVNTLWQKQRLYPQETYRAIQSGMSIGYRKYPPFPAVLWPAALKRTGKTEFDEPTLKGKGYEGYKIAWNYVFEDTRPLIGVPHLWVP